MVFKILKKTFNISIAFISIVISGTTLGSQCYIDSECSDPYGFKHLTVAISSDIGSCSGTLLGSRLDQYMGTKALVLTASHCFSNPASLNVILNYRTQQCGSQSIQPTLAVNNIKVLENGNGQYSKDWALLLLEHNELTGWARAGWSSGNNIEGTVVSSYHHSNALPRGYAESYITDLDSKGFMSLEYSYGQMTSGGSGSGLINSEGQILGIFTNSANSNFSNWQEKWCPNYGEYVGNIGLGVAFSAFYPKIIKYLKEEEQIVKQKESSGGGVTTILLFLIICLFVFKCQREQQV